MSIQILQCLHELSRTVQKKYEGNGKLKRTLFEPKQPEINLDNFAA